jgi:endonuclease/exonuclease/phosphatase family metal-dependent hydrolase
VPALRVVTWNIRAAIGPGPFPDRWWSRIDADRLRAIGAFLSALDADVVALQEVAVVSRSGTLVDLAGDLARQLDAEAAYGAVRTFDVTVGDTVTGAGLFGNALVSRRPMGDARTLALPCAAAEAFVEPPGADHPAAGIRYRDAPPAIREPRCLLLATIDGVRVGTAHFSHVGSGERRLQAQATAAAFDGDAPALVLGDLNAAIDAPELSPLAPWTDAFAEPTDDPARVTTDDGWPIDQVLARDASVSVPARVLRHAGDLSDHYPVLAEVTTSFVVGDAGAEAARLRSQ